MGLEDHIKVGNGLAGAPVLLVSFSFTNPLPHVSMKVDKKIEPGYADPSVLLRAGVPLGGGKFIIDYTHSYPRNILGN